MKKRENLRPKLPEIANISECHPNGLLFEVVAQLPKLTGVFLYYLEF